MKKYLISLCRKSTNVVEYPKLLEYNEDDYLVKVCNIDEIREDEYYVKYKDVEKIIKENERLRKKLKNKDN